MKYEKCCYFCKYFQRNPNKKYYSHCLKDDKKLFEIQSMYAQYCLNWCPIKDYKEVKKVKKEIDLKKMKYFDVKVVKVRKGKGKYIKKQIIDGKLYGYYLDKNFNNILCLEEIKKQHKGDWVNGENLDKIKFPCFCSFSLYGKKVYGELDYVGYNRKNIYLKELTEQIRKYDQHYYTEFTINNLDQIIIVRDIHILKGKIILFENKEGD